ncbi:phosphoenolpyruvate carboxylase, partial [Acidimicrobiaceae bacterium USS-CC1]|nr:phosphoenolpyruvate carboxylase [Acidiferrimicrobium australe]
MPSPPTEPSLSASDDIRLLGRLLGEVIAEQSGPARLELIEQVRQAATAARRGDVGGPRLEALLDPRSDVEVLDVARAFSYFSFLANLAQDVADNRLARAARGEGRGEGPGTLAFAMRSLGTVPDAAARQRVARELWVSPVLTAHPTEVRRRTVLDRGRRIAALLAERARAEPDEQDVRPEEELRVEILALWQTAILRGSRLRVRDEIDEMLHYYDLSLFEELPRLQERFEQAVEPLAPAAGG